jgi:hypothetical protein
MEQIWIDEMIHRLVRLAEKTDESRKHIHRLRWWLD